MFDKKHRVREQIIQNGDQVSIKQMYKHEIQFREKAKDHRRQEIMIDVRLLEFTYSRFGFG